MKSIAQTTLELCKIPSVTGEEGKIADFLENFLMENNLIFERYRHSIIAKGPFDKIKPTIMLVGHHDTVPPHKDDIKTCINGNKLYGRGASDMKSGVAVIMHLIKDLDFTVLPYNIQIVFYDREEGKFEDSGLELLFKQSNSLKADFSIVLESTNLNIHPGCQGTIHANLTFKGKTCHSSRPWEGENAIHKAANILKKLAEKEPTEVKIDGLIFKEVMQATMAQAGVARNVIPDHFELNLNYRYAPDKTVEEACKIIEQFINNEAEIEFIDKAYPGPICSDNPLYKRLIDVANCSLEAKQGWTDVARLAYHGIDSVNYGPGLTSQAHQLNEYVMIDDLVKCYDVLKDYLTS